MQGVLAVDWADWEDAKYRYVEARLGGAWEGGKVADSCWHAARAGSRSVARCGPPASPARPPATRSLRARTTRGRCAPPASPPPAQVSMEDKVGTLEVWDFCNDKGD